MWKVYLLHIRECSYLDTLKDFTDIELLQETYLLAKEFYMMHKVWVGEVLGSSSKGCRARVLILLHKYLPYTLEMTKQYDEGSEVTVTLFIGAQMLTITNIYAPNAKSKSTYQGISERIKSSPSPTHLVAQNINKIMSTSEDRKGMMLFQPYFFPTDPNLPYY